MIKFDTEAAERAAQRAAEEYKAAFDAIQQRLAGFDSVRRAQSVGDETEGGVLPVDEESEEQSHPEAKAE